MLIQNIKDLIVKAKLGKALEAAAQLPQVLRDDENQTTIIMLTGQYHQNERSNRLGLSTSDEYRRSIAKITHGLLGMLDDMADEEAAEDPTPSRPSKPTNNGITKILFLASNPSDTAKLQLDTEYTRISSRLQDAEESEKFPLKLKRAVTPSKFAEFLVRERPNIVHFSGHGDRQSPEFQKLISESRAGRNEPEDIEPKQVAEAGIFLMDEDLRQAHFVSTKFLSQTFENAVQRLNIPINIVIFNACHSGDQASAVSQFVPYVIGTNWRVKDDAAIAFSTGFYFGIAQRMTVETAFNFGIAQALAHNETKDRFLLYKNGQKVEY